jgi:hypothetical protein
MQKSVVDEIRELKAQLQSKTEKVKNEASETAREAINFLRELGVDDDTILKELGFRWRNAPKTRKAPKAQEGRTSPEDEGCPICTFLTDPPHDGRSHRGQTKKKPFTAEELAEKGLARA